MHAHQEGSTPKMISCGTGINTNTIKSILPKLKNVKKITHGLYLVEKEGDIPYTSDGTSPQWNFHNLILSFPVELKNQQIIKDLNLVKLDYNITNNKCTLRVSTDYPLSVSAIVLIHEDIKQTLHLNINLNEIVIKSIEFNKDFSNLKLEGVNCISLENLFTQFKLYQKKIGLRVEHKTKIPFSPQNMVDMLSTRPQNIELQIQLNKAQEQLEKLTRQSIFNTNQLNKLIEVINK